MTNGYKLVTALVERFVVKGANELTNIGFSDTCFQILSTKNIYLTASRVPKKFYNVNSKLGDNSQA